MFSFPADILGINWAMMPLTLGDAIYIALDQPPEGRMRKESKWKRKDPKKNFLKYDLYVGRFLAPSVAADLANCQFFPPDPEALASPTIAESPNIQIW